MIQVETIILKEIELPLKEAFISAHTKTTTKRVLLLELITKNGASVWSECVALETPNYLPETIDTSWILLKDYIAPLIV
ncbi:o-succinylbenzoate synthase, partial [Candidatus Marinamargulisbacteria bacterium SCGC AG-439-L15]